MFYINAITFGGAAVYFKIKEGTDVKLYNVRQLDIETRGASFLTVKAEPNVGLDVHVFDSLVVIDRNTGDDQLYVQLLNYDDVD